MNPEVQRSEDDSPASSVSPSAHVDHMPTGPAHIRALLHRHLELVHPRRPHRVLTPWRRRYLQPRWDTLVDLLRPMLVGANMLHAL
jgi:hypothetical protein